MRDADLDTLSEIGGDAAKLIESAFDAITPAKKQRNVWYGPIGLVMTVNKKLMVCSDGKKFRDATEEETTIWNEFVNKLKP